MDPASPVPEPQPVNPNGESMQPDLPTAPLSEPQPSSLPPTLPAAPMTGEVAPPSPHVPIPSAEPSVPTPIPPTLPQASTLFSPDAPVAPQVPTAPQGPVTDYTLPTAVPQSMSFNSKKKSKLPLLILVSAIVLLLLGGGAVFAFVLPNRPEKVWSTGLSRTGKALDSLVTNATEKSTLESFKKSEVSATLNATTQDLNFSGTLATKYDDTGANGNLVVVAKQSGQPDQTYSLKFIGQLIKDHTYPTTYLQLNGLKALGYDALLPGLSSFDGKWITIDEQYFNKLGLDTLTTQKNQVTASDIAELAKIASRVTTKRVFTADSQLNVFERRKFIGKESVDGLSAYHYEVGLNKQHLADYCKDLVDSVMGANAYKKLPFYDATKFDEEKKSAKTDCDDSVKDIKDTDTFDMWIDAKYKLVYKMRITDEKDKDTYVDIGQKYTGGDDIHLFLHTYDAPSKADGVVNLKTNIKTSVTSLDATITSKSKDSPYDVKISLTAKPFTGTVDTKAPAGSIKLEDVLKQLGIDPAVLLGSTGLPGESAN